MFEEHNQHDSSRLQKERDERGPDAADRQRHEHAEEVHRRAANTHAEAAEFWEEHDKPQKAAEERDKALKNLDGAELERDRAAGNADQ